MIGYLFSGLSEGKLAGISLAMLISGGIGNMIDRIALGYVVDFIDFRLINFAIFNGADSFVCVGAGLLVLSLILDIYKESKGKAK
jgi:signal peptidase II